MGRKRRRSGNHGVRRPDNGCSRHHHNAQSQCHISSCYSWLHDCRHIRISISGWNDRWTLRGIVDAIRSRWVRSLVGIIILTQSLIPSLANRTSLVVYDRGLSNQPARHPIPTATNRQTPGLRLINLLNRVNDSMLRFDSTERIDWFCWSRSTWSVAGRISWVEPLIGRRAIIF